MKNTDLCIRNILMPDGRVTDISVDNGRIVHLGAGMPADEIIEGRRRLCMPGAIDMHVHMRGGPQAYKEDWKSGTKSAVAGGVVMVVDQPNTIPPITTGKRLLERVREAEEKAYCRFAINGGVTPDAEFRDLWASGAMAFGETFAAASSYGTALGPEDLRTALAQVASLGALVTIHAEEVTPGDDRDLLTHDHLRSAAGEARAVRSVSALAPPGCRLHFCHLSSAESVMAAGKTSFEVMPHHLFLSREAFEKTDARGKVNPPLRSERERKALWSLWDRIPVIASDHAPHTVREKSEVFTDAPSGIPGVETMLPLLMAKALSGDITLKSVIEKTVLGPAALLGLTAWRCSPGDQADLVLYPKVSEMIDPEHLHSKADWSPYEGLDAIFPEEVIINGAPVFSDGEFFTGQGQWIKGAGA